MALAARLRDVAIGLAATVGFVALLKLGLGRGSREQPAPAPAPVVAPLPSGPEPTPADGEVSVLTLLREMADLDHLARLPSPRFTAHQTASTDRRSRRPGDESWFANDDFVTETAHNLVRVEAEPGGGKRYVLLDATGPGAVVRIWSATPAGTLRIYIDDDPRPAVEAPFAALLAGELSPFAAPLGHLTARGYNLYFPFPYRRRCVITVDNIVVPNPFSGEPMARLYYQIGYRTYAADAAAQVRPFAAAEVTRAGAAVARVAGVLRDGLPAAAARPGRRFVTIPAATADPKHPLVTMIEAQAKGARIAELRLETAERATEKLAATTLAIAFDGEETVRAPLVELFGTGPGWSPYVSLPMTVGADGALVCRFPMPFRKRAVVTLSHAGAGIAVGGGRITVDAAPFDDETLLFHAGWRPREVLATRPFRDWHVGTLEGAGQQVGTLLDVENPPNTSWWGEGDEKITVDGEAFPSIFGTGTEDYFGFAWSTPEPFAHAYHAQTRAPGSGFSGLFSMNRFLVVDPVPFSRSLRFDLEIWHWSETSIAASALLYWYARPGARDDLARTF
jgi:hypothetical protein